MKPRLNWHRPRTDENGKTMTHLRLAFIRTLLLAVAAAQCAGAAEWQWSVAVQSVISTETNDHPRAFLWVPPNCQRVRAVVVGQHNMEEEPILEHPIFRKAASDLGFAEVWITPALSGTF